MINCVTIISSDNKYDFEKEINERIGRMNVKDIKFCVNPRIKQGYTSSYSNGAEYYAMIIYEL